MARVNVHHDIGRLAADMADIGPRARVEMRGIVKEGIKVGNDLAKDFARRSSGTHARKYAGTFSARMLPGFSGFGSTIIQGEYGPRSGGQGDLASVLEGGSRNNKPHLNLARSADTMGPALAGEVGRMVDGLFW